ncbi:diguanylate cyclase, partial [Xanthomonas sp. Kuri4-3]
LRLRGEQFSVYDHRVGLPRDKLFRIIDDGRGFFWLSSNHGVFRVARVDFDEVDAGLRRQLGVDVVDRSDGMPANQGNGSSAPAGWLAHSGDLMFPTSSGLGVIDPMRVGMLQQHRLPIVFERVAADGVVQALQPAFRFEADTRRIVVGYAGLSFRAPDKVRYRYRLEGFDPDWVDAGSATEAIYTNLPPGRYRFQVQAMTLPVDWTREEVVGSAALALTLTPPWWRREGMLGAGLLLLAGVLSALYLWRIARFRQQQRTLGRVIDARTRELSDKNLALLLASQEREDLVRRLEYQASHDVLTGLPNRREAERFMQARVEQALAEGGRLSLVLADIDHFKRINDAHGHLVGDEVLRNFAQTLLRMLRTSDTVARYGGEEFLVILPNTGGRAAMAVIQRVLAETARSPMAQLAGGPLHITFSAGLATHSGDGPLFDDVKSLLKAADQVLYRSKHRGRNRVTAHAWQDATVVGEGSGLDG